MGRVFAGAGLCVALCLGCKDPAERQAKAEERAQQARALQAEAARSEAERKAEAARAHEAQQAEAARAEELAAKGALSGCCQALARRGFEERSMSDMAAKKLCVELEGKGASLDSSRTELTQVLEARALPSACAAPPGVAP